MQFAEGTKSAKSLVDRFLLQDSMNIENFLQIQTKSFQEKQNFLAIKQTKNKFKELRKI